MTSAVAEAAPAPAVSSAMNVAQLDLKAIRVVENYRIKSEAWKAGVAELAASMKTHGQLDPILVAPVSGEFTPLDKWQPGQTHALIDGERRLTAAKQLGWASIACHVRPVESRTEARGLRAVANLQHADLTPVEEAEAVRQLLDSIEDEMFKGYPKGAANDVKIAKLVRSQAVEKAAARLGKDTRWVRDRDLFSRLGPKTRQLLLDGKLTFAHGRELAKLADPRLGDQLAPRFAASKPDEGPADLARLKDEVSRHLFSLAQVPWQLKVPFAGKPACELCPHNSVNQPGLFDAAGRFATEWRQTKTHWGGSGTKEPSAGVCTLIECFTHKREAAARAVNNAAQRAATAVARAPKKDAPSLRAAAADVAPEFLRPAAVAAKAEGKLESIKSKAATPKKSGGKPAEEKPKSPYRDQAKAKAEREWHDAVRNWERKVEPAIWKALFEVPLRFPYFLCMTRTRTWNYAVRYDAKPGALETPKCAAMVAALSEPTAEHFGPVQDDLLDKQFSDLDFFDLFGEVAGGAAHLAVAKAMKLNIPHPPQLEYFMPKPKQIGDAKPTPATEEDGKLPLAQLSQNDAAGLFEKSSLEQLMVNRATVVQLGGVPYVVAGNSHRGSQCTAIELIRAREAGKNEGGLTYAALIKLYDSGKRGRGDHRGQLVTAGGKRYLLGDTFEFLAGPKGGNLIGRKKVFDVEKAGVAPSKPGKKKAAKKPAAIDRDDDLSGPQVSGGFGTGRQLDEEYDD